MGISPILRPARYDDLPGWAGDDHEAAFAAFRRSAAASRVKPYRAGGLGVACADLAPAFARAEAAGTLPSTDARSFFEHWFVPHMIDVPDGFVTGYYEPVVAASGVRDGHFRHPLLAPPADLVEIDDATRPPDFDPDMRFALRGHDGRLRECPDRAAIEAGALEATARPLAWLSDRVDAFFVHVQGAAVLAMPDGSRRRVTYAAKSGHRFTGPGRVLAEMGELDPASVTMQAIRAWLGQNPVRVDEVLHRNRSYIFFRETPLGDPGLGPVAAAKVQLEPGRSLAVDRLLHCFGSPVHVSAPGLDVVSGRPFARLMIAQDTGSAIVGPARGDIFVGTGPEAGEIAGVVKHAARFHLLVPKPAAGGLS
jgi:membrane-bound lytic murein transglycosylase A